MVLPHEMIEFLRQGAPAIKAAERALSHGLKAGVATTPAADVRICSPLPRPNSIRDFMLVEEHVRGSFKEVPAEWYEIPVYWKVNADTVFGPEDPIRWPCYTEKLDFELELAAVIGCTVDAVSVEEAQDCIAGYTIFNDWSARDLQHKEMGAMPVGPSKAKDFAMSLGPFLVTPDELAPYANDPSFALTMEVELNGERFGVDRLDNMAWSFGQLIAYASRGALVQAGDIIGSGTCGDGCIAEKWGRQGFDSQRALQPGDVVTIRVEHVGEISNTIVAADELIDIGPGRVAPPA